MCFSSHLHQTSPNECSLPSSATNKVRSKYIQTNSTGRLDGLRAACSALQNGESRSAIVADIAGTEESPAIFALYVKPLVNAVLNGDPVRSVLQISREEKRGSQDGLFVENETPSLKSVIEASLSLENKIKLPKMRSSSSHNIGMPSFPYQFGIFPNFVRELC